jgi:hypothetical protein
MIYKTEESGVIEKARVCELNNSEFRNTQFQVESAIYAQGHLEDM